MLYLVLIDLLPQGTEFRECHLDPPVSLRVLRISHQEEVQKEHINCQHRCHVTHLYLKTFDMNINFKMCNFGCEDTSTKAIMLLQVSRWKLLELPVTKEDIDILKIGRTAKTFGRTEAGYEPDLSGNGRSGASEAVWGSSCSENEAMEHHEMV